MTGSHNRLIILKVSKKFLDTYLHFAYDITLSAIWGTTCIYSLLFIAISLWMDRYPVRCVSKLPDCQLPYAFPSILWHCWLAVREGT